MLPTITIDVGTTSVKLCLFDAGSDLVSSARLATPTVRDVWGEVYDLDALHAAVAEFIRELDDSDRTGVRRIAITGVGESGGLVRADGSLASPMILWHDHRGAERLAPLSSRDRSRMYEITGLPVNANYGLSKIAWAVDEAQGELADAQWLNIAEYLAASMTGERWSEFSLASRTMALDVTAGTWSAEAAALLGVDVAVLPKLATAAHGEAVTAAYAQSTGLSTDVRVHVAGHDHMVGAVGAELQPGELLNSTGTTEGLLFLRDAPSLDARTAAAKLANGISCTGDSFTLFASIPTGGSAFATLQTMLGRSTAELSACVNSIHERYVSGKVDLSTVPLVLPQFRGSPPPTKQASARGIIAGLHTDTSTEDIVLGCFLGMALQFRDVLDLFPAEASRIKVIGPASGNPLWLQLKADLLGTPLSASRLTEVVSRGAQALASDARHEWASCLPDEVSVDERRNEQLVHWYDEIRPQWEYLKGLPA